MKNTGLIYQEPTDPRDVYTTELFGSNSKNKTDWGTPAEEVAKILGVEDQKKQKSCVGQTFSKLLELYHYLEKKEVVKYSARYIYVMTDTFYQGRKNSGLSPINALKFLNIFGGLNDDRYPDINGESYYEYYKGVNLETDLSKVVKTGAYAYVPKNDLEATKKALDELGALGFAVYKGKFSRFGRLTSGGTSNHAVLVTNIEKQKNGKHKVYFLNSWGTSWGNKGIGYFYWEDLVEDDTQFFFYTAISQFNTKVVEKVTKIVEVKKKANPDIDPRFPNFPIFELVNKATYDRYGSQAFTFLDQNILAVIQAIRDMKGKGIKVNDWKYGGKLQYRGYDDGGFRGVNSKSQHRFGRALDWNIPGENSLTTIKWVEKNSKAILEKAGLDPKKYTLWIEKNTNGWIHIDLRSDPTKVNLTHYSFNA